MVSVDYSSQNIAEIKFYVTNFDFEIPDFCDGAFSWSTLHTLSTHVESVILYNHLILYRLKGFVFHSYFNAFILFRVKLNKLYIQTSAVKLIVHFYSYLEEEITSFLVLADLVKKDADERIFKGLGLTYGAAVRFKHEFLKLLPTDLVDKSPVTSLRLKPTMGVMSGFDPDMKRMYLSKYVTSTF